MCNKEDLLLLLFFPCHRPFFFFRGTFTFKPTLNPHCSGFKFQTAVLPILCVMSQV